jgi:hypothetical protein
MSDYGVWHQPAFGTLHTRPAPGMRTDPRNFLAREGPGDWRKPAAVESRGKGLTKHVASDHRREGTNVPSVYVAKRNGLPVDRPYSWREARSGWAARIAARNLDLAAIAAADAVIR